MKQKFLITPIFFLFLNSVIAQEIREGQRYSSSQLSNAIAEDVKLTITRDDLLTLAVKEIEFSKSTNNKYLVELLINCYGENRENGPTKTFSYAFEELKEVKVGKELKLVTDFRPIFQNIPSTDLYYLEAIVKFTRLADPEIEKFKSFANAYVGKALDGLVAGDVIKDVVGIGSKERGAREEFSFRAFYYIPYNFKEYYEQSLNNVPVITNEKDEILTIVGKNKISDNSVVGKLSSFVNGGSKFIYGEKVINNDKFEYVEGYCKLYFSKNFITNIPPKYTSELSSIMDSAEEGDSETISTLLASAKGSLDDYKRDYPNHKRNHENIKMYLDLMNLYKIKLESEINNGNQDKQLETKYRSWLQNTSKKAGLYNYTQIFIRDIYDSYKVGKGKKEKVIAEYDASIYIPYSLGNEYILDVIFIQEYLHEYISEFIDTLKSDSNIVKAEKRLRYFASKVEK